MITDDILDSTADTLLLQDIFSNTVLANREIFEWQI
jgi:hypothetical protein